MTRRINPTERSINSLKSPAKGKFEHSIQGIPGLRLVHSADGTKRWLYRYAWHRRKCCLALGVYPGISVMEAKTEAAKLKSMLLQGENPVEKRDKMREMPTFRQFCEEKFLPHAHQVQKNPGDTIEKLNKKLYPYFGEMLLSTVCRADLEHFRTTEFAGLKPSTINRYHAMVARVMQYSVETGVLEHNPLAGVKKLREPGRQEVFLNKEQSAKLVAALSKSHNRVHAAMLKLLLFTGMRKGEASSLKWEQINLADGLISLPETKSGKPQMVILSDAAMEILKRMEFFKIPRNPHVFPHKGNNFGHIIDPRKTLNAALKRAKLPEMRVHDLRHSYASQIVENHSLYIAQALLRHSTPQMTQRYAHLSNPTLREAANAVGDAIIGAKK